MINSCSFSFVAIFVVFVVINASPSISFQTLTKSRRTFSPTTRFKNNVSVEPALQLLFSSFELKSSETDNEDNDMNAGDGSLDVGGVLGSVASTVVLYSEFVLKTTGCGLPAGPFGVVGAVEGVSYLGVVATCAAAAVDYFSEDGLEGSDNVTRRLATALGLTAAAVGIAVLAFQVTDYGYIPNAVPMEGGMCK